MSGYPLGDIGKNDHGAKHRGPHQKTCSPPVDSEDDTMMIAMSEMVLMMVMMMVMMATTMAPSIEVQTKKTGGPPVPENKKFTGRLQEVHTGPIDVHVQRESVYMSACASKCPLWIDVSVTPWLTGQC